MHVPLMSCRIKWIELNYVGGVGVNKNGGKKGGTSPSLYCKVDFDSSRIMRSTQHEGQVVAQACCGATAPDRASHFLLECEVFGKVVRPIIEFSFTLQLRGMLLRSDLSVTIKNESILAWYVAILNAFRISRSFGLTP